VRVCVCVSMPYHIIKNYQDISKCAVEQGEVSCMGPSKRTPEDLTKHVQEDVGRYPMTMTIMTSTTMEEDGQRTDVLKLRVSSK